MLEGTKLRNAYLFWQVESFVRRAGKVDKWTVKFIAPCLIQWTFNLPWVGSQSICLPPSIRIQRSSLSQIREALVRVRDTLHIGDLGDVCAALRLCKDERYNRMFCRPCQLSMTLTLHEHILSVTTRFFESVTCKKGCHYVLIRKNNGPRTITRLAFSVLSD
jgi:hypothetical protein